MGTPTLFGYNLFRYGGLPHLFAILCKFSNLNFWPQPLVWPNRIFPSNFGPTNLSVLDFFGAWPIRIFLLHPQFWLSQNSLNTLCTISHTTYLCAVFHPFPLFSTSLYFRLYNFNLNKLKLRFFGLNVLYFGYQNDLFSVNPIFRCSNTYMFYYIWTDLVLHTQIERSTPKLQCLYNTVKIIIALSLHSSKRGDITKSLILKIQANTISSLNKEESQLFLVQNLTFFSMLKVFVSHFILTKPR